MPGHTRGCSVKRARPSRLIDRVPPVKTRAVRNPDVLPQHLQVVQRRRCTSLPTSGVVHNRASSMHRHCPFANKLRHGRGSLPVTSPEQTAIDICSVSAPQSTLGLLADAVTSRRTTAARLLAEAERRPNLRQRAMITEVLRDVADGIHSNLEERFHTFVERTHGLTGLRRQVRVQPGEFTDILLEDHRLVIELGGRLGQKTTAGATSAGMSLHKLHLPCVCCPEGRWISGGRRSPVRRAAWQRHRRRNRTCSRTDRRSSCTPAHALPPWARPGCCGSGRDRYQPGSACRE